MSNVRITDFANYTTILNSASDVIPIVDVTNNVNKKITVDNLFAGRTGGNAAGTVTSIAVTVPQGLAINPVSPITTAGTLQLSWSGQLPLSSLASNTPTSALFLRGDNTWAQITSQSGTVNFVGLTMPPVFQVINSDITTSGTITVLWDTLSNGKVPAVNLGGVVPSPASQYYLRADGIWANPVGTGIGSVSSVTLTVPQGLLVNGSSSAVNTVNSPFVLTWDSTNRIPLTAVGANTPDDTKFLRGDGWYAPSVIYQNFTPIQYLGALATTSPIGSSTIVLTGQYSTSDIPSNTKIYFGANATIGYTVQSITSDFQTTTITLTTALQEVHFIGASVYKFGSQQTYNRILTGSYLKTDVNGTYATIQDTPVTSTWLSGSLIPVASQGTTGQYYYVTSNSAVYLKKDNNYWEEQLPLEQAIDNTMGLAIQTSVGTHNVINAGRGYDITYNIYVQPVNLFANVVIQGFKYITTEGAINTVNLTIQAPPTGWTIGDYANLALGMQMAINALANALPVIITNDDFNLQLRLRTSIPSTFTSPNPPLASALQPSGIQSGSYLSNITVASNVGPASSANLTWNFDDTFETALTTQVQNSLTNILQLDGYFFGSIPNPNPSFTVVTPATGWSYNSSGTPYIEHAGDLRSLFIGYTVVAFSQQDYQGIEIGSFAYTGSVTRWDVYISGARPDITSTATCYLVNSPLSPLPAGTNLKIIWVNVSNTLTNLSYSNGIFTNTSTKRVRATFSVSVYLQTAPLGYVNANQASLWFQLNDTNPDSGLNRRGQFDRKYAAGTGVGLFCLTSSWTFDLNPNDTIISVVWCTNSFFVAGVLGSTYGAQIDVIEV